MKEYFLVPIEQSPITLNKLQQACHICGNIGTYYIKILVDGVHNTFNVFNDNRYIYYINIVLCTDPKCFEYFKLKEC